MTDPVGSDTMVADATTYAGPERRRGENALRRMFVSEMTAEELRLEILTDELTGLSNSRAFQERDAVPGEGIVLVDCVGLKWINENLGRAAGDALLVLVSGVLRKIAEFDGAVTAYRLSGDEFALVVRPQGDPLGDRYGPICSQIDHRLPLYWNSWKDGQGETWRLRGVIVTWGIGECLDSADLALRAAKVRAQEQGTRAVRGERPPGLHVWKESER